MHDNTPVLIGAGQFTYRGDPLKSPSPLMLLKIAAERAAADAGLEPSALAGIDSLGVVGFAADAEGALAALPFPRLKNPPKSLAGALGAEPRHAVYAHMGGNSPQYVINHLAERIANGEADFALAVGAEFLGSLMKRLAANDFSGWEGDAKSDLGGDPLDIRWIGDGRPGVSDLEALHGLGHPVNTYPLFENALRARDGCSLADHQRRLGRLFAPFTKVAAAHPDAWFPIERTADELVTVTPANRMVGYPYPKYLNAIMQVDQCAGVLMTSVGKARELGVPPEKWIFLHGCADAHDLWNPIDRQNFHSSPAMRMTGRLALEMAGVTVDDLDYIDLYSCFPSAVQVGAEELGLALDDPRGLTVTGGLPYFGGPGNNYSMHAVATLVPKLRGDPDAWGLSTANGWYLTKQSVGVYSARPFEGPWERQDPAVLQREIDALPHPPVVEHPQGRAVIETYTVVHARDRYRMGIIIGRDEADRRFVAVTPDDEGTLKDLESREGVGRTGTVGRHPDGRRNLFTPD